MTQVNPLMTSPSRWTEEQLEGFRNAAQSLKLYRRAEIPDESGGPSAIRDLYVDPLPSDHVLQTILKPNTTFLIGRKGTGKSTVFQRAQFDIRHNSNVASAYVDIKTVFESSQVDPALLRRVESVGTALPRESVEQLLLYRSFLRTVIEDIRAEIKDRVQKSFWDRVKSRFSGTADDLFADLDRLLEDIDSSRYLNLTGTITADVHTSEQLSHASSSTASAGVTVGPDANLRAGGELASSTGFGSSEQREFVEVLLREFDIKAFILRLKKILGTASIKHLYLFLDDFSELPEPAMRVVVDALLAPLNNWSDELIKLKIAAYPSRIYFGEIDKAKVDEVNLDIFHLYGRSDIVSMENKAIEFTKRLVSQRVSVHCSCEVSEFIASLDDDELWRSFFYASMGNPRTLGYLLYFIYETHIIYNRSINLVAVRDAAQRYYTDKIETYFSIGRFLQESFSERASIYSLKELLEAIVSRSRELRHYKNSRVTKSILGFTPSSHFHVPTAFDSVLSTLELNFFVTKYFEMKDRDGRDVSVYALNFGLCQDHSIAFGRPVGQREYRLYYVERVFDYTGIVNNYLKSNQEVICDNCNARYETEDVASLQMYGMLCPACKVGKCRVVNLSRKYEELIRAVDESLLLPSTELGILQTLEGARAPMFAADIAGELDVSYQLVGKRGLILSDRGLVSRTLNDHRRRQFRITERAEETYFSPAETIRLNVDLEKSNVSLDERS